jgi:hypothetical protein
MENPEKESESEAQLRSIEAELQQRRAALRKSSGPDALRLTARIFGIAVMVGALLATLWITQWFLEAIPRPERPPETHQTPSN